MSSASLVTVDKPVSVDRVAAAAMLHLANRIAHTENMVNIILSLVFINTPLKHFYNLESMHIPRNHKGYYYCYRYSGGITLGRNSDFHNGWYSFFHWKMK